LKGLNSEKRVRRVRELKNEGCREISRRVKANSSERTLKNEGPRVKAEERRLLSGRRVKAQERRPKSESKVER